MKINKLIEADFFYGAKPEVFEIANILKKDMTNAEKILWKELRNNKQDYKFRRQHPISEFIVDFYCHQAKLAIEIDGNVHDVKSIKERDEERTILLNKFGIRVIRFTNQRIENDLEKVLYEIKHLLTSP